MQTTEATRLADQRACIDVPREKSGRPSLNPVNIVRKVLHKIIYPAMLRMSGGVYVDGSVIVKGWPHLEIDRGATVRIGNRVTLNSSNQSYHINMHSPVKLYAEGQGTEIVIGADTRIHGTCLHACERIEIGEKCLIAANTQIFDSSGHDLSFENVEARLNTKGQTKPVIIEDCVWIGANCLILPGVRIGHGSVIAAGSVVTKSIPPMSLAGGNPARVIKSFTSSNA